MALQGTLRDFALPDIFQLIGMQRKTGMLTLENERETVTVLFENGMVVHADSSVRRLDDLLGNVLVRQGKIKRAVLEEALAKQKVSMQRLGYILTSQGYIAPEDLREALSEQVQQIVFRIFRWKDGSYHFDPDAAVDYDRANVTPVSTDHILMEGIRRVDEWPIIEKRIPSLDVVFRPLVPASQIRIAEEGGGGGGGLEAAFGSLGGGREESDRSETPSEGVTLTPLEARVYEMVNGKRSVAAIVEMTGLSDFDVCRTLFDFLDRRLIAQAKETRARAVATAGRRAGVEERSGVPPALVWTVVALLAAAGAFVGLGAPFRVPAAAPLALGGTAGLAHTEELARLHRLDRALRLYYLAHGAYPDSLDALVRTTPPLVRPEDLVDADGRPFRYERGVDRVRLEAVDDGGEPYLTLEHEVLPEPSPAPASPS